MYDNLLDVHFDCLLLLIEDRSIAILHSHTHLDPIKAAGTMMDVV